MYDIIAIPIAIIAMLSYMGCFGWMIYDDHRIRKQRRADSDRDMTPCVCGHMYWIHWLSVDGKQSPRPGCHDFKHDYPCKCKEYRMDTLTYLQRKYEAKHK